MKMNKIIALQQQEIIMVLGSTIDCNGKLSAIAIGRLQKCIEVIREKDNYLIVLTGGFGSHFNITNRMYSLYAYEFLIKNGVGVNKIAALIPSTDTVEDATLSKKVIEHLHPSKMVIITSDFHQKRVQYIFSRVYKDITLDYATSAYIADNVTMKELTLNEEREIKLLKETNRSSIGSSLD